MSMDSALQALAATKDAVALLFGLVILFVTPQVLRTFRDIAQAFREEMQSERAGHREETKGLTTAIHDLASETRMQTAELSDQSEELRSQTKTIGDISNRFTEATAMARSAK